MWGGVALCLPTFETMRKFIKITFILLFITPCLQAQRKVMSQARSYIKSGKDFDKAEKLMTDLLKKDSANKQNPKIYLLLYQAQKKQYEVGNEQLYLKQKYDTASLFNVAKRMFATAESLDSIDASPDGKGRVKLTYRKKHSEELDRCRPNLYYGGVYYVRKKDYTTAYDFFDTYIDCANQPMFATYNYAEQDQHLYSAAYWATACGQQLKDAARTLHYSSLARRDTVHLRFTLRNIADAYLIQKNDSAYSVTLLEGFNRFPLSTYFFPRLVDYYTTHNRTDSALAITDRALTVESHNELFLLAKSTLLLNIGRYEECISVSDTLISLNDSLPDAYLNAGTACLNRALTLEESAGNRESKTTIRAAYRQALFYMERYRKLAPDEKGKWGAGLYRIYLNLNMGKQFEEIDKILNK